MPRQTLDTREDLAKQRACQVAFGQLQREVPGMLDKACPRPEQPLLKTRDRPTPNGCGQDEPTQQIGCKAMTPSRRRTSLTRKRWQERRVQWAASLPSLIYGSAVPRWTAAVFSCASGTGGGYARGDERGGADAVAPGEGDYRSVPESCPSRAHSGPSRRTRAHGDVMTSRLRGRIYARFSDPGPRPENPGVGGSIPSQRTIVLPTCNTLGIDFQADRAQSVPIAGALQRTGAHSGGRRLGRRLEGAGGWPTIGSHASVALLQ